MGQPMLKLGGKIRPLRVSKTQPSLLTITTNASLPSSIRHRYALLSAESVPPAKGYGALLLRASPGNVGVANDVVANDVYELPGDFHYLKDGDIISIDPTRPNLQSLFRKGSPHNTILLTERCNHYCLMCSQPPKETDDSYLLDRTFDLISLIPKDTQSLGFSGGEPTLYGDRLVDLIKHTKLQLPTTSIDILSNGRRFKDKEFSRRFGEIDHPDCMIGIPVYSDDPVRHDYVVQARGAFDETIQGILNLKRFNQKVEIRVVVHKETIERLVQTCEFICRNLLFVDHVALMGLEITGFTRPNLNLLWVDPYEYRDRLSEALAVLNSYGMNSSVYNHQLCVVNSDVEKNYRKSISDWKNEYLDACGPCTRKGECGGFFSSSKMYRHSDHINPFT
jgi:His-Xaa-Ser system radical SAM maturase HxsC